MTQVTDATHVFLLEAVRKRPQDSAGHHAVVHPISPSAGRDGGLPSGGHLFPPAGHLLELHQSNVSQSLLLLFLSAPLTPRVLTAPHLSRVIIFYHTGRARTRLARRHAAGRFRNAAKHATLRASPLCVRVYPAAAASLRGRILARVLSLFHP